MYTDISITAILCGIIAILVWMTSRKKPNLPPGPLRWPIIGSMLYIGQKPHIDIANLASKYGDILSIYFGNQLMIFLNSVDVMKDVLLKNRLEDRPQNSIAKLKKYTNGMFIGNGKVWKEHRKFTTKSLKIKVGNSLEDFIQKETLVACKHIQTDHSYANLQQILMKCSGNIVCSFIFGKRYDYDDEQFNDLIKLTIHSAENARFFAFCDFLPYLSTVYSWFDEPSEESRPNLLDTIHKMIRECRTGHTTGKPRHYVDEFLDKLELDGADSYTEDSLACIVRDMFAGGTRNTVSTLSYGLLFMILHPDIQAQVHAEIDNVIQEDRAVSINDKHMMPFTEATIYETQRLANVGAYGAPYMATMDIVVSDYTIPKGAWVFGNQYSVNIDTRYWHEPDVFNPDRFLAGSGKVSVPPAFLPYGVGRRLCMGDSMAKLELFIIFATLMKNFTFSMPDPTRPPTTDPKIGIALFPQPFTLVATKRT